MLAQLLACLLNAKTLHMKIIVLEPFLTWATDAAAQSTESLRGERQQLSSTNSYQAKSGVPTRVYNALLSDAPTVSDAQWDRTGKNWRAYYMDPKEEKMVDTYYDKRGRRVDTHVPVGRNVLPDSFRKSIEMQYHPLRYQVTRIDRPKGESVFQVVLHDANDRTTTIYCDREGKPI